MLVYKMIYKSISDGEYGFDWLRAITWLCVVIAIVVTAMILLAPQMYWGCYNVDQLLDEAKVADTENAATHYWTERTEVERSAAIQMAECAKMAAARGDAPAAIRCTNRAALHAANASIYAARAVTIANKAAGHAPNCVGHMKEPPRPPAPPQTP